MAPEAQQEEVDDGSWLLEMRRCRRLRTACDSHHLRHHLYNKATAVSKLVDFFLLDFINHVQLQYDCR